MLDTNASIKEVFQSKFYADSYDEAIKILIDDLQKETPQMSSSDRLFYTPLLIVHGDDAQREILVAQGIKDLKDNNDVTAHFRKKAAEKLLAFCNDGSREAKELLSLWHDDALSLTQSPQIVFHSGMSLSFGEDPETLWSLAEDKMQRHSLRQTAAQTYLEAAHPIAFGFLEKFGLESVIVKFVSSMSGVPTSHLPVEARNDRKRNNSRPQQ